VKKALITLSFVHRIRVMLASSASAQDLQTGAPVRSDRPQSLFSGPVSLPHVALPAGTYLSASSTSTTPRSCQVLDRRWEGRRWR